MRRLVTKYPGGYEDLSGKWINEGEALARKASNLAEAVRVAEEDADDGPEASSRAKAKEHDMGVADDVILEQENEKRKVTKEEIEKKGKAATGADDLKVTLKDAEILGQTQNRRVSRTHRLP